MKDLAETDSGTVGTVRDGYPKRGPDYSLILERITEFQRRFVWHKSEHAHTVTTLWIAHTYAINKFRRTPRLYIHSPEWNTGKSTQGELIAFLSRNGKSLVLATEAVIFRSIENDQPSFVIDEADTLWSDFNPSNDGLRAIINKGYERGAQVERCNIKDYSIESFNAYCPIALVGIDNRRMPETILSRSIPIKMARVKGLLLEEFDHFDHEDFQTEIRASLQYWADEFIVTAAKPEMPAHLQNRNGQIWTPLFVIANAAGGDWPEKVLEASMALVSDSKESENALILKASAEYGENQSLRMIAPANLARAIEPDVGEVSPEKLGRIFASYGVESRKHDGRRVYDFDLIRQKAIEWGAISEGADPTPEPSLTVPTVPADDDESDDAQSPSEPAQSPGRDDVVRWGPEYIEHERQRAELAREADRW